MRPVYRKWSAQDDAIIARYAKQGPNAIVARIPGVSIDQVKGRILRLKKAGALSSTGAKDRSADIYRRLAPLDPESCQPDERDNAIVVRRGVGQWKADVPAVRWVFDLGVACD